MLGFVKWVLGFIAVDALRVDVSGNNMQVRVVWLSWGSVLGREWG